MAVLHELIAPAASVKVRVQQLLLCSSSQTCWREAQLKSVGAWHVYVLGLIQAIGKACIVKAVRCSAHVHAVAMATPTAIAVAVRV